MFHPRCYARRPVSPFLTGLHLIDNFPLRSLARLPQLSIVLDNVDGSLTTVVVCFDKFIHTNVIPKSLESVLSLEHVPNGELYFIARLTVATAKAERVYFTKRTT